jgi:hypothetical protein
MNQPTQKGLPCKNFFFSIFFPKFQKQRQGTRIRKKYSTLQFFFNCYTGKTGAEM